MAEVKKMNLSLIETFSGVGMQRRGIENSGLFNVNSVATCELDINAIISYAAIHCGLTPELVETYEEYPSREEMAQWLIEHRIGYDFTKDKEFDWNKKIKSKSKDIEKVWLACKLSHNFGDIAMVQEFPKAGMLTFSFPCVTDDSLILTTDGYKPMEDVKVGDTVLTKSNTWHKVAKKFDNGVHDTYYIDAMGFENMHCTLNHKFYVREMYRTYPTYENGKRGNVRHFKEPVFKEAKDLTKKDYFGIPVINEEIPFYSSDLDFWWMIGYYVGDGYLSVTGYDIRLCCNDKKLEKIKEHLDINKYNYTISDPNISCHKVRFANKEIYEFISKYIGTGCENKHIPYEILMLPKAELKAFLNGYLDSDGNINTCGAHDQIRIDSVNRQVIYSTSLIINKVYHRHVSIYKNKKRVKPHTIDGRLINSNYDVYQLKFKYEIGNQDKGFYEDGYIWFPFNKLVKAEPANVYNIEVEEDHSYILQGCISKNCTDISIAGKQKGFAEGETRSGLVWEVVRILKNMKNTVGVPNFLLMENVDALVNKKNIDNYNELNKVFKDELGYNCKWEVLNAKWCGVPQNRNRVFAIYYQDKIDLSSYEFPKKFDNGIRLKDILEDDADESLYINSEKAQALIDELILNGTLTEEDYDEECP